MGLSIRCASGSNSGVSWCDFFLLPPPVSSTPIYIPYLPRALFFSFIQFHEQLRRQCRCSASKKSMRLLLERTTACGVHMVSSGRGLCVVLALNPTPHNPAKQQSPCCWGQKPACALEAPAFVVGIRAVCCLIARVSCRGLVLCMPRIFKVD